MTSPPDAYPSGPAVGKHDLLGVCSLRKLQQDEENVVIGEKGDETLLIGATNKDDFVSTIRRRIAPEETAAEAYRSKSMRQYARIYTYEDAPTDPRPLSRALVIVGLLSAHSAMVQEIMIGTDESDPSCGWATSCVVATKLADKPHRRELLTREQLDFADNFAKLMTILQRHEWVALLGADRDGRIGLLRPLAQTTTTRTAPPYTSVEYAGECLVSTVQDVEENVLAKLESGEIEMGGTGGAAAAAGAAATAIPTTPPMTPPTSPPTTPPPPPGDAPPENDKDAVMWKPPEDDNNDGGPRHNDDEDDDVPMWKPPDDEENGGGGGGGASEEGGGESGGLWKPPDDDDDNENGGPPPELSSSTTGWMGDMNVDASAAAAAATTTTTTTTTSCKKRPRQALNDDNDKEEEEEEKNQEAVGGTTSFHTDSGADAADRFYSNLKRELDTRADSRLYHMRAFNGFVKATQISELDPQTGGAHHHHDDDDDDEEHHSFGMHHGGGGGGGGRGGKRRGASSGPPLRVLDLACGKGGDLGKWTFHPRGLAHYVGVDVARGSLCDAALRARKMRQKLNHDCTFVCADLGCDVLACRSQKLLTWSLATEEVEETAPPQLKWVAGGGILPEEKFDVVSIQFAIHYMMSSRTRARRFFRTVSDLLHVGGALIATTIDARVAVALLMDTGVDLQALHSEANDDENDKDDEDENDVGAVVSTGGGACRLSFGKDTLRRLFPPRDAPPERRRQSMDSDNDDQFGLEYTFTLVEGSNHEAGVGEAVDLPEWLTPLSLLKELALEAGLELEYALNFHEFFQEYSHGKHSTLYNMKVLNRNGSISMEEWQVSRLYMAVKFKKVGPGVPLADLQKQQESSSSSSGGAATAGAAERMQEDNDKDDDDEEEEEEDDFGLGGPPPSKKSKKVSKKGPRGAASGK